MTTPTSPDAERSVLAIATELVTRTRHGSPSMIKRRLNQEHKIVVTFGEAVALLDQMEARGIVGPAHGSFAREVFMNPDEVDKALRGAVPNATPTHCSTPECNADGTGEPCATHEREQSHAEGEHELCGSECDAGLRQRIAEALAEHRASFTTHVPTEHACCADALLSLMAADRADAHEAGRVVGLREGANALQAVIDRDRAQFPHQRGQSWIALGGARQILLGLIDQQAGAVHQDGQP